MAVGAFASLLPYIERPLEPGAYYLTPEGQPPRRGDVRAETLAAVAEILETSAAVRSTMTAGSASARADAEDQTIATDAFSTFSAPGGLPVEILEWSHALEELGGALTFLDNPRLGDAIGAAGAHDALERAAAHAVCVLALIDARRAEVTR